MKHLASRLVMLSFSMVAVLLLVSCGEKAEILQNEITEVALDEDGAEVTISAALTDGFLDTYGGKRLYLFELTSQMGAGEKLDSLTPVADVKVKAEVSFSIPLYDGVRSRLYSSFVVASYDEESEHYAALTSPRIISNPEALATVEVIESTPEISVKGLVSAYSSDAVGMGIAHTMLDVHMDKLILDGWQADAVAYTWNGTTQYVCKSELEALDAEIAAYTDAGVRVYLRFLLAHPVAEPASSEGITATVPSILYQDQVEAEANSVAVNMADSRASVLMEGFFAFMAGRYAVTPDGETSLSAFFIIGKGVNRAEGYAETASLTEYVTDWEKLLRVANQAMKSHTPDGRVYLSLDSDWSGHVEGGGWGIQSFLSAFDAEASLRGNYDWHVAAELYAATPSVWAEDRALDAERLTVNSLSSLTDLLGSEKYRTPAGEVRRLVITDLSIPLIGSEGVAAETSQAASYAYAYAATVVNGKVEALLYGSYLDGSGSAGLRETEMDGTPGKARKIYEVFRVIDTDDAENAASLARAAVGQVYVKLESVLSGFSAPVAVVSGEASVTGYRDDLKAVDLITFRDGDTHGVVGAGDLTYLSLEALPASGAENMPDASYLYARFDRVSRVEPMGISTTVRASDLIGGKAILLDLYAGRSGASSSATTTVTLRLVRASTGLVSAGDGTVMYESSVAGVNGSVWQTASFDISEFTKRLDASDEVMLSVLIEDEGGKTYMLGLDTIHVLGTSAVGGAIGTIVLVTVIILLLAAIGAVVYLMIRKGIIRLPRKK